MADAISDAFASIAQSIANLTARLRALEALPLAAQSYSNLLLNGGFEQWAGGWGPFTADGAQSADEWYLEVGAGSMLSVARDDTTFDSHYSSLCAAVTYTHAAESALRHTVVGPFAANPMSFSVRVRTTTPNAVRLLIDGQYSRYHTGSGLYETLVLVATPLSNASFDAKIAFDASCAAYVDNAMLVQGAAPIDYIAAAPGGTAPWTFEAAPGSPVDGDSVLPLATKVFDWAGMTSFYMSGFHVDPSDSTRIIIENSGRYRIDWIINFHVIQPAAEPTWVPVELLMDQIDVFSLFISLPAIGPYGGTSAYFYEGDTPVIDVAVQDYITFSVYNSSAGTTITFGEHIYIRMNYLGPIPS